MPTLIALIVFALSGLGLTAWLRRNQAARPAPASTERSADELSKLRWRDFAKLVLQVMRARGYRVATEEGLPADGIPTDGSDIVLEREGVRTLLSCKYGSGAVVGAQALLGLAKSATLRGTGEVIVVTPGRFEEEAARIARQQNIELIDGQSLWPEVRPYVSGGTAPAEAVPSNATATRMIGLAWGGAAVIGGLAWMLAQGMQPVGGDAAPQIDAPAHAIAHTAATTPQPTPQPTPVSVVPTEPAALEARRREAANAITTLFGVDRALWSTQSTLLVYLSAEDVDPTTDLCPLLERYPELAASRVQLQPPAGSSKPVRFKQCRTY
ncbi:restriction endonuclease [Thermomonas fusca]|nr:restriction endonuclease [Thermomonas fusca]